MVCKVRTDQRPIKLLYRVVHHSKNSASASHGQCLIVRIKNVRSHLDVVLDAMGCAHPPAWATQRCFIDGAGAENLDHCVPPSAMRRVLGRPTKLRLTAPHPRVCIVTQSVRCATSPGKTWRPTAPIESTGLHKDDRARTEPPSTSRCEPLLARLSGAVRTVLLIVRVAACAERPARTTKRDGEQLRSVARERTRLLGHQCTLVDREMN